MRTVVDQSNGDFEIVSRVLVSASTFLRSNLRDIAARLQDLVAERREEREARFPQVRIRGHDEHVDKESVDRRVQGRELVHRVQKLIVLKGRGDPGPPLFE